MLILTVKGVWDPTFSLCYSVSFNCTSDEILDESKTLHLGVSPSTQTFELNFKLPRMTLFQMQTLKSMDYYVGDYIRQMTKNTEYLFHFPFKIRF